LGSLRQFKAGQSNLRAGFNVGAWTTTAAWRSQASDVTAGHMQTFPTKI